MQWRPCRGSDVPECGRVSRLRPVYRVYVGTRSRGPGWPHLQHQSLHFEPDAEAVLGNVGQNVLLSWGGRATENFRIV